MPTKTADYDLRPKWVRDVAAKIMAEAPVLFGNKMMLTLMIKSHIKPGIQMEVIEITPKKKSPKKLIERSPLCNSFEEAIEWGLNYIKLFRDEERAKDAPLPETIQDRAARIKDSIKSLINEVPTQIYTFDNIYKIDSISFTHNDKPASVLSLSKFGRHRSRAEYEMAFRDMDELQTHLAQEIAETNQALMEPPSSQDEQFPKDWAVVDSPNFLGVRYERPNDLVVRFLDGTTLRHHGVEEDKYLEFISSTTPKKYYEQVIKPHYQAENEREYEMKKALEQSPSTENEEWVEASRNWFRSVKTAQEAITEEMLNRIRAAIRDAVNRDQTDEPGVTGAMPYCTVGKWRAEIHTSADRQIWNATISNIEETPTEPFLESDYFDTWRESARWCYQSMEQLLTNDVARDGLAVLEAPRSNDVASQLLAKRPPEKNPHFPYGNDIPFISVHSSEPTLRGNITGVKFIPEKLPATDECSGNMVIRFLDGTQELYHGVWMEAYLAFLTATTSSKTLKNKPATRLLERLKKTHTTEEFDFSKGAFPSDVAGAKKSFEKTVQDALSQPLEEDSAPDENTLAGARKKIKTASDEKLTIPLETMIRDNRGEEYDAWLTVYDWNLNFRNPILWLKQKTGVKDGRGSDGYFIETFSWHVDDLKGLTGKSYSSLEDDILFLNFGANWYITEANSILKEIDRVLGKLSWQEAIQHALEAPVDNDDLNALARTKKVTKTAVGKQTEIPLTTKVTDNYDQQYRAWISFDGDNNPVVNLQEETGKTAGKWSWHLATLRRGEFNRDSTLVHGGFDTLFLDYGQNWHVTGVKNLVEEALDIYDEKMSWDNAIKHALEEPAGEDDVLSGTKITIRTAARVPPFYLGDRVKIDGGGVYGGQFGTIVHPNLVKEKTDEHGIPRIGQGHYKPVNWKDEIAIMTDGGQLITMFKNYVRKVDRPKLDDVEGKKVRLNTEVRDDSGRQYDAWLTRDNINNPMLVLRIKGSDKGGAVWQTALTNYLPPNLHSATKIFLNPGVITGIQPLLEEAETKMRWQDSIQSALQSTPEDDSFDDFRSASSANWFRRAESQMRKMSVRPRYYGTPGPEGAVPHDYDPSWDYEEELHPKRKMMKAFEQAANNIATRHVGEFKGAFSRFRIAFVKDASGGLAQYINGTPRMPVIVIDLGICAQTQKELKYDFSMRQVAMTTLMHELRHAYQDATEMNAEMDPQELEDDAEKFGMRFM